MKYFFSVLLIALVVSACSPYTKYADTAASWENDISLLEFKDDGERYSDDAVLFVGSSSIRKWENIKEDMAPYEPIRRGYGGAHFSDLIHFTKRLVYPHNFRALCIFVANDIIGSEDDKTPKEVLRLYKEVVNTVRIKYANVPIFYIGVTPTGSRWDVWPEINKANLLIQDFCNSNENSYYIDTGKPYLTAAGIPNKDLFIKDQLHQNQAGYDIWAELIKTELDKVLPPL